MNEASLESFVSWLGFSAQALAIVIAAAGFTSAIVGWMLWKNTGALDKLKSDRTRQMEQEMQLKIDTARKDAETARLETEKARIRESPH
jgi:hypothetical protein